MNPKHILLAGGGLLLLATGAMIFQAAKTGNKLIFTPEVGLPTIGLSGVTVRLNVRVQNPTRGRLRIKHPFLAAQSGGVTIGTSRIVNREYTLNPFSEITIRDFLIDIPLQQAGLLVAQITRLLTGQISELPLDILVSTFASAPGVPTIAIEEPTQIVLKNPLQNHG